MGKRIAGLVALTLLALSLPALSVAQETVRCESEYVVQNGDWLSKIAAQFYGDYSLYPAIVLATNARSASESSFATIADPWRIEPEWKLCLPSAEMAGAGFTIDLLKNSEYLSEWTASGTAPLTDGEYQESIMPGSATKIIVQLSDRMAFGYTSDGQPLAAIILITDPGGSGTFYHLSAVVERDGKPANIAQTLLGDRVKINSLAVEGDEIVVDMVTQGPDDPFCCPTQRVVQKYALKGDQLMPTSTKVFGEAGTAGIPLAGTLWKLDGYLNSAGVLAGTEITAVFGEDGRVAGSAGCNNYTASYAVEGNAITFGPAATTRMMCNEPQGIMEQESAYLAALASATAFQIAGNQLTLTNADGVPVATFTASEAAAPDVAGTVWQWVSTQTPTETITVDGSDRYTIEFQPGGEVRVQADCNVAGGTYTLNDSQIKITITMTTLAACPPDSLGDEFIKELNEAATALFDGGDLLIDRANDSGTMRFVSGG